jgi:hypothetical protein
VTKLALPKSILVFDSWEQIDPGAGIRLMDEEWTSIHLESPCESE